MFLHTMEFKTPQALFARLTEVEKIDLRRASPGRVDYLFNSIYCHEVEKVDDLLKVQELCNIPMREYDALDSLQKSGGYIPSMWRF